RGGEVLRVDEQDALVGLLGALGAAELEAGDAGGAQVEVDAAVGLALALGEAEEHFAELIPLRLLAVELLELVVLTGLAIELAQGAHRLLVGRLEADDLAIDLDGLRRGEELLGEEG